MKLQKEDYEAIIEMTLDIKNEIKEIENLFISVKRKQKELIDCFKYQ